MTVKELQSVPNAVSIYLKNGVLEARTGIYAQSERKLISGYGVQLADGYETIDFTAAVEESEDLAIVQSKGSPAAP